MAVMASEFFLVEHTASVMIFRRCMRMLAQDNVASHNISSNFLFLWKQVTVTDREETLSLTAA